MNNWRKIFSWEEAPTDPFYVGQTVKILWDKFNELDKEDVVKWYSPTYTAKVVSINPERGANEIGLAMPIWMGEGSRFYVNLDQIEPVIENVSANLKLSWEELTKEEELKINILHAIYSAEAVLPIFENKYPNDNRPRLAIEAAKTVLKYPTEENKAKAKAAAWAADDAADDAGFASHAAAYAAARAATWAAAWAADAAANAIKYAKKAAKEANIDIDFDSLLSRAQEDIWEYINISESSNTSEASLKLAWEDEPPLYKAIGFVYGRLWDGNEGGYPSIQLEGFSSIEALIEGANKKLEDRSLDSGMGFLDLKGAILYPLKTIGSYYKEPLEPIFIGSLTEREKRFLASL
jgi:hypothetical protein